MILGIAGSFGAGKGAVVEYLVGQKGFTHYSASGYITEEVKRRELPVDRDSMILVGNALRAEHGPSAIVDALFALADAHEGDAVIESLRAVAEVRRMKELGGVVLGVDADPEVRYERSIARGSEKDNVSFEKWRAQEEQESNPDDPTKQNIFGALKEADFIIMNNGSLDALHGEVERVLALIP